jgi:FKBP-type peptidyl-prolyl cis-trans isomerase
MREARDRSSSNPETPMKLLPILAAIATFAVYTSADDIAKKDDKLKMPPLDAKEWKELKGKGGLKVWDVKEGKGDEVKAGGKVKVHYTGWLKDGTIFDSSVQKNEPIEFSLNRVIKGWKEGVPGMKPGAVRRLYIPAELAYGKQGYPGAVPPDSDLIFEIELLEVK